MEISINMLTNVLTLIPDIKSILKENERISFYRDALLNNLNEDDALLMLSIQEEDIRAATRYMQTKPTIEFTVVRTEGLKNARFLDGENPEFAEKMRNRVKSLSTKYTIIVPAKYGKVLNKDQLLSYAQEYEISEEELKIIGPGASQLDLALYRSFKDRFPQPEKEEKEQEQEKEEELERERSVGGETSTEKEEENEEHSAASIPIEGEEKAPEKEKKEKKKKKEEHKRREERPYQYESSHASSYTQEEHKEERREAPKEAPSYDASKTEERKEEHHESLRYGSMSVEKNLARDSEFIERTVKTEEELRKEREQEEASRFSKDTANVFHASEETERRANHSEKREEHASNETRRTESTENRKEEHLSYNEENVKKWEAWNQKNERYQFDLSEESKNTVSGKAGGSYKEHAENIGSETGTSHEDHKENRASDTYTSRGIVPFLSDGFDPSKDHGRDPYKIVYDIHKDYRPEPLSESAIDKAKSIVEKDVKVVTGSVNHLVKEAAQGGDSDGGYEYEKYERNTAPVRRYIGEQIKLGITEQAVKETAFNMDAYASAMAVQKETTVEDAKKEINDTFQRNGITPTNVLDTEKAIKTSGITTASELSRMTKEDFGAYIEKASVPEEVKNALSALHENGTLDKETDAVSTLIETTRNTVINNSDSLRKLNIMKRDIPTMIDQAGTKEELLALLKEKGADDNLLNAFSLLDYEKLKTNSRDAITLIDTEMLKDKNGGANLRALNDLNRKLKTRRIQSFGEIISRMDETTFAKYLIKMDVSKGTREELLRIGIRNIYENPELLTKVIKNATEHDKAFIKNLKSIVKTEKMKDPSLSKLSFGLLRKALQTAWRGSEGSQALWENFGYAKYTARIYKESVKILLKTAGRNWSPDNVIVKGLKFSASPLKSTAAKVAGTKTGNAVLTSRFAESLSRPIGMARKIAGAPGRFTGATTRWAARSMQQMVISGARNIMATFHAAVGGAEAAGAAAGTAGAAGGAAAGGTAVGTAAGGWVIIVIALVILIIVYVASGMSDSDSDKTVGNYQYTQLDPDFQQEILNELQNLNDGFEEQVNQAANNREFWANATGFSESDSVSFYESGAYSVHYRDDLGNELDHLNIDNSKEILSLASNYCKYADWSKPGDDASEDEKLAYEQIKQYYLDYCKFLWVSTHRIDIEEYRPGNSKYADEDNSGLQTNAAGKCPKDGTKVWLCEDFTRGSAKVKEDEELVCGESNGYTSGSGQLSWACDEVPGDPNFYEYGENALCTHPMEGKEHNGWKRVVDENGNYVSATHYLCTSENGHYCSACSKHDGDKDSPCSGAEHVYHKCGEICPSTEKVFCGDESHKHTAYQWEYCCGGHMGAVIYITVGSVSRLKDMGKANDFDYSNINDYPDENANRETSESTSESAAESTSAAN